MSNNEISAILDELSEAIFVVDDDRRVVLANTVAQQRFGDVDAGQDLVRYIRHPDCLAAVDDVFAGANRSTRVIAFDTPVRALLEVAVAGLPAGRSDGARAVLSLTDISEKHEVEKMRSDFVANVSHELRSPLTAMAGFIETLKNAARDDPAARARFLDLMEHEASRMVRLVADLLSLSKVEVNERLRPTTAVDLAAVVGRAVAVLADTADRDGKLIHVDKPSAPQRVSGDEDELLQVFHNLIENALKYGGQGTDIRVCIAPRDDAVGFRQPIVAVDIHDHGPGIAAHHIPRLTERFYRVDNSRSRELGGTGLGLAIVKHILNRHRGRLQIKSEPNVGSTFTVLLPGAAPDG